MQKKPQLLIGIGIAVAVLVLGGGALAFKQFAGKGSPTPSPESKKRRVSEPVNVIPVTERPYVQIVPQADGHNVIVRVAKLNKPATGVEYELEYQAGSILQGAFGQIALSSVPSESKVLLGSCSAGGACTFHEDVKGGTLLLRFEGETNYAVKSDWRYHENKAKESTIASKDAKFQLDAPELKKVPYAVVYNSPGYPGTVSGTPVSDLYSLAMVGTATGKGTLVMRASEEGTLQIMGWDGKKWQSFDTKVDGKQATAEVTLMDAYIVVKK